MTMRPGYSPSVLPLGSQQSRPTRPNSSSRSYQRGHDKGISESITDDAVKLTYTQFPKEFFRLSLLNCPSGLIVIDRDHLKELFEAPDSSLNFS